MSKGLFGSVVAEFALVGELVSKRELTSEKAKDWKLHVWKIASRGSTFEVQVDPSDYDRGVLDSAYAIKGQLGNEAGRTKLIAKEIRTMDAMPPKGMV